MNGQPPHNQVEPNNESDTFRESQCIPGEDPQDINQGCRFVFLKRQANEKMHKNKRKVKYIFEGEEEQAPGNLLII